MQIDDKRIIVTGAASGIGLATLKQLSERDVKIIAVDINSEQLSAACDNLKDSAAEITPFQCDLTQQAEIEALFDFAHVKRGETVLIQGGSGGVGSMAIQFAKWAGATVIATASIKKHDYIKSLGADVAIDYHEDFESRVEKVDLVFDCVGGDAFTKSLPCLRRGGRIVSILEQMDPAQAKRLGIEASYVFVRPNGAQLATIADLIDR